MPTLVDSLFVELGLDASAYEKGRKEAETNLAKTKDAFVKQGKIIEETSKGVAQGISKIATEVLALYAALTGINSLKGFIADLVSGDAALGRFSANTGLSAQFVSTLEKAVGGVGGTAEATAGTIAKLSEGLTQLRVNGKNLPDEFYRLQSDAKVPIDTTHGMPGYIQGLATAFQKLYAVDPQKATLYANALNVDPGTLQLMVQYGAQITNIAGIMPGLAPSPQDIANAQAFQKSWNDFSNTVTSLFQNGFRELEPTLGRIVKQMADWVEKNRPFLQSKIDQVVLSFANALKQIDWTSISSGMSSFAAAADNVASAINSISSAIKWLYDLNESSKDWPIMRAFNALAGGRMPDAASGGSNVHGNVSSGAPSTVNQLSGIHPKNGIAGARAGGGSVNSGDSYLVGERGPEILRLGSQSGSIVPNNALGGGDISIDGRPVTRSNPLPTAMVSMAGAINDMFFGGAANLSYLPGGGMGSGGGGLPRHPGSGGGGGNEAAGPVAPVSGNRAERAKKAVDYFVGQGLSREAAMGIVAGTIGGESDYGASNQQRGDKGTAFGIGQWHMDRVRQILAATGIDVRTASFEDQLKAMRWEMEHGPGGGQIWNKLKSASMDDAVRLGVNGFERPLNRAADIRKRLGMAHGLSSSLPSGAGAAAVSKGVGAGAAGQKTSANVSHDTQIGQITIHTQARDAKGIAVALSDAIQRNISVSTANYGPA